MTNLEWRVLGESFVAAVVTYLVAGTVELTVIRMVRPTMGELAWVSDVVLATAFAVAVYLWRHLVASRRLLAERERAEVVIRTQLSLAADIQRRLLPALPVSEGVDWAASLVPAGQVGGDFYDFVDVAPGCWLVMAADVSGKGVPAALAIGSLRSAFRTIVRDHHHPATVLRTISDMLHDEWGGTPYATGIVVSIDVTSGVLVYANAGHPSGLVVGTDSVRLLAASGPPAGLLPGIRYEEHTVRLHKGDHCVLMSDGVTEAIAAGTSAALEQIVMEIRRHCGSARAVCEAVMALALHGHGPPGVPDWTDDRTVVVMVMNGRLDAPAARAS